jgi:hypothetical protein
VLSVTSLSLPVLHKTGPKVFLSLLIRPRAKRCTVWRIFYRSIDYSFQRKFIVAGYLGSKITQEDRSMNFHISRSVFLSVAFGLLSMLMSVSGYAQNWQDPAFQQPVRQYFSGERYPLSGANDVATVSPTPVISKPVSPRVDKVGPRETSQKFKVRDAATPAAKKKKPVSKPSVDKKTAGKKKKSAEKEAKAKAKKKEDPHHPVMTWDVYRDRSPYPIDPRKPCFVCKRQLGDCECGCPISDCGIGNQGMPWQDTEPGGRSCGKKCCGDKRPEFSVYWPKPLSARRANREGCCQACGHAKCCCRKINDLFDHLVNFKLIDYQRKDSGYCGPEADPYGCLGESRSQVAGTGFRFPSEPFRR